jgi:hypothetical protein
VTLAHHLDAAESRACQVGHGRGGPLHVRHAPLGLFAGAARRDRRRARQGLAEDADLADRAAPSQRKAAAALGGGSS